MKVVVNLALIFILALVFASCGERERKEAAYFECVETSVGSTEVRLASCYSKLPEPDDYLTEHKACLKLNHLDRGDPVQFMSPLCDRYLVFK